MGKAVEEAVYTLQPVGVIKVCGSVEVSVVAPILKTGDPVEWNHPKKGGSGIEEEEKGHCSGQRAAGGSQNRHCDTDEYRLQSPQCHQRALVYCFHPTKLFSQQTRKTGGHGGDGVADNGNVLSFLEGEIGIKQEDDHPCRGSWWLIVGEIIIIKENSSLKICRKSKF